MIILDKSVHLFGSASLPGFKYGFRKELDKQEAYQECKCLLFSCNSLAIAHGHISVVCDIIQ